MQANSASRLEKVSTSLELGTGQEIGFKQRCHLFALLLLIVTYCDPRHNHFCDLNKPSVLRPNQER